MIGYRALSTGGVDRESLSSSIKDYIDQQVKVCQPKDVYICDGSEEENAALLKKLEEAGRIRKLDKYDNWLDVVAVESSLFAFRNFFCTVRKLLGGVTVDSLTLGPKCPD